MPVSHRECIKPSTVVAFKQKTGNELQIEGEKIFLEIRNAIARKVV